MWHRVSSWGICGCEERVVGMLRSPAKPGAVQAKLQAKGASNLLHLSTGLLSTEMGSTSLVRRMLSGGTGHVASGVELGVCQGVQSA